MQEDNNSPYPGGNAGFTETFSDNVINILPGTFAILSLEGKFLKWNKRFETVFGYTAKEVEAIGPLEFFADDTKEYITKAIQTAFTTGFAEVEAEMVTKTGEKLYYFTTANKVKYNGQDCLSAIGIDISAKRQAEKDLGLSKATFAGAYENSPIGLVIVSTTGQWLSFNQALLDMLGYSKEELLASTFQAITHPDDLPRDVEAMKNLSAGKAENYHTEKRYFHKNGSIVWGKLNVSLIKDELGKPSHFVSQIENITDKKNYEADLIQREQRYNAALDGIGAGVWDFTDIANQMLDLSPKYMELIGRKHENRQYHITEVEGWIEKDDYNRMNDGFNVAIFNKKPEYSAEAKYIMADGTLRWFLFSGKLTYDTVGTPIRAVGSLIDIHDRKAVEAALVEREQRYDAALQGIDAGVWDLIDLETGRILLSAKLMQLIGRTYENREYDLKEIESWIVEEDLNALQEAFKKQLEEKTDNYSGEARVKLPTGGRRWFSFSGKTLRNSQGVIIRVTGSIIDIHSRKQAEERLSMSHKELSDYKIALDESSIVAITDQKGIINYVNDNFCKISKYSRDELIGQDHRIINSGYHSKEFIRDIWVTIANGKIWRGDLCNRAKDGTIYWVETTIVPFLNEQGKPWQYVAIRSDITDRKNAEEQREKITADLLQRNKDLEQFTYIVSHNLRAPVANIIGFSSELKETSVSDEEKEIYINELCESADRLDMVIKDLNDILQVKQNVSEVKEVVSFSKLLRLVKAGVKNSIDDGGVVINANFEVDEINTLKSYMHSIFQNLITNSIKYRMPNVPPVIDISSHKTDKGIVLEFQDNGIGIDLEKQGTKVFGLYKRFHPHIAEGKGIGLFMVKTQVEALGGEISVLSLINTGTKFIIRFNN